MGIGGAAVHVVASALEFTSNPIVGAISDERGRKGFLLMSLAATVVTFFSIGVAPSKFTIAVSGALRGLTAVSVTMGNSMVVDVSQLAQREHGTQADSARQPLTSSEADAGLLAGAARGDLASSDGAAADALPSTDDSGTHLKDGAYAPHRLPEPTSSDAAAQGAPAAGAGGDSLPDAATRRASDAGSGASGAPQDVTVNLGFLLAAAALGLMCGPIVGGVLSIVSLRAPFILAACVELLNMLFVKTLVPETLERRHRTMFSWQAANPVRLVRLLCATVALRSGAFILVLVNLALAVFSQVCVGRRCRACWGLGSAWLTCCFGWTRPRFGRSCGLAGEPLTLGCFSPSSACSPQPPSG